MLTDNQYAVLDRLAYLHGRHDECDRYRYVGKWPAGTREPGWSSIVNIGGYQLQQTVVALVDKGLVDCAINDVMHFFGKRNAGIRMYRITAAGLKAVVEHKKACLL